MKDAQIAAIFIWNRKEIVATSEDAVLKQVQLEFATTAAVFNATTLPARLEVRLLRLQRLRHRSSMTE
jgi:hypothetical protein